MAEVKKSALVPYSAKMMYDLVNDVNKYPEFLPGCVGSDVLEHSDTHMLAALHIAKAGIRHTFTTRNTLIENNRIQMSLADGPFKHLSGGWTFTELDEYACKIELHLQFEFTSRIVALAFGKIFNTLANSMVDAFIQRAKEQTKEVS
ncbi:MAG: type II toxin-antitoxin system RatA family toxin [Glaciecola sp.]|jgi:ribosome-associated toxin RatA of RatAB toxin-antitoxin module